MASGQAGILNTLLVRYAGGFLEVDATPPNVLPEVSSTFETGCSGYTEYGSAGASGTSQVPPVGFDGKAMRWRTVGGAASSTLPGITVAVHALQIVVLGTNVYTTDPETLSIYINFYGISGLISQVTANYPAGTGWRFATVQSAVPEGTTLCVAFPLYAPSVPGPPTDYYLDDITVGVGYSRIEGYLSLGSVSDVGIATQAATAMLAPLSAVTPAVTVGLEPTSPADSPWTGFNIGDTVTVPDEYGNSETVKVVGLSVTEDGEGNPLYIPEVGTLRAIQELRVQNWLQTLANGSLAGSNLAASPALAAPLPNQANANPQVMTFHWSGSIIGTISDPYPVDRAGTLSWVTLQIPSSRSTPIVVAVIVSGVTIGSVTLPAGQTTATGHFNTAVLGKTAAGGSVVQLQATTIPASTTGMVGKVTII